MSTWININPMWIRTIKHMLTKKESLGYWLFNELALLFDKRATKVKKESQERMKSHSKKDKFSTKNPWIAGRIALTTRNSAKN